MRRDGTWGELSEGGGLGRFLLIGLGVYLHAADSLVTATLIPDVVEEIGGAAYIAWTISLYQLGAIVVGSATAMLCQRAGVRHVLVAAALVYASGCMLAAVTPTMPILLGARLVQGMGGGALVSAASVVVQQSFPEHLWGRLFGIVAIIWTAGSLLGPLIGGIFAHFDAWRLAFWSFALQAALLATLIAMLVPSSPLVATAAGKWSVWPLLLLSAATLAIAEAGLAQRTDLGVPECVSGVGLLWLAALIDRRSDRRLLPEETLNLRNPVGLGLLMVLALATGSTSFWAYGPVILKALFSVDPLMSGSVLAGEAIAWTVGTLVISGVAQSAAGVLVRLGAVLVALGGAAFTLAVPSGNFTGIVVCALCQGAGFGVCWPSIVHLIVRNSGREEASLAAAAPGTMLRIGYSVGAAASGIAANASGLVGGINPAVARVAAFWVFAAFIPILIVAVMAAWLVTSKREARS